MPSCERRSRPGSGPESRLATLGAPGSLVLSDESRELSAEALGFDRPMANSLDGVAARDFALEVLGAASICAVMFAR